MKYSEVRAKVYDSLVYIISDMVPPGTIISEESTYDDLGLDSFHPIEITMELEETLDIFINDNDIVGIDSVEGLVDKVTKLYVHQK